MHAGQGLSSGACPVVRRLLRATLSIIAVVAVVAVLIIIPLATENDMDDSYWRLLGVVAILDALGTEPLLSAAVESRIAEAARERGVSKNQLVSDALDSLLGS